MLAQQLANGLVTGLIYGLLALGFSLAFCTTRVVNFAHGELFTLGAFGGIALQRSLEAPFLIAAVSSAGAVAAMSWFFAFFVLWHLRSPLERAVATIALGLGLRDGMLVAFGSDSESFSPVFPLGAVKVAGIMLPKASMVILVLTLILLLAVWILVQRTRIGLWMRATAQDEEFAASVGIRTRSTQATAFGLGALLAAAAGLLVGPTWQVHYAAGATIGVKAFTAAMVGGLGRLGGAVAGGIVLGISETFFAGYVSSSWKDLAVYVLLVLTLLFFPNGLFAAGQRRLG